MLEKKRKFDLQLFNDGDGGEDNTGGNDDNQNTGGNGGNQNTGGNGGNNGNSNQGGTDNNNQNTGGNKQEPFAVFPDEASFMGRVRREANKQQKEFVQSLGLEDTDQLKNIVQTYNDNIEKNKTDLQKAQDKMQTIEQERDNALQQINNMVKRTEAQNVASELGVNPNRVDHFLRLANLDNIEVKDGQIDRESLKSSFSDLLKELPEFKMQQANQGGSDFGGDNGDNKNILTMDKIKNMSTAEMSERIEEINEFMAKQNK